METSEDYYPRLESIRDNLGNVWVSKDGIVYGTGDRLSVGDTLEFVVSATDPMGQTVSFKIGSDFSDDDNWQEDNVLRLTITPEDVRNDFEVFIYMRSPRPYHARGSYDDAVIFKYEVVPPSRTG